MWLGMEQSSEASFPALVSYGSRVLGVPWGTFPCCYRSLLFLFNLEIMLSSILGVLLSFENLQK